MSASPSSMTRWPTFSSVRPHRSRQPTMQCNSTSKLTYAPDGSLFGLTGPSFGISFAGPLLREHESAWVLVSLYSLGDTFLLCSHLKTFRHRHGESAQRIALVIKRSHLAIASMFSEHFDSVHVVEDAFLDQVAQHLMRYGIKSGFGPNQALFVHPHHINDTRVDEFCNIDGVSQANMYANLLRLPILSPLTPPRVNRNVQDELDHLIDRYGIRKGKSAIIFPDTNSWPGQIAEAVPAELRSMEASSSRYHCTWSFRCWNPPAG